MLDKMLNLTTQKMAAYLNLSATTVPIEAKEKQRLEEKYLLEQASVCPLQKLDKLQENLSGLNIERYKSLLKEEFYNAGLMEALLCTNSALYYASPSHVTPQDRVRDWIQNLRQVGTKSAFGYAMQGGLRYTDDLFVIKAPRREKYDDLQHELVVGLYGTNQLRHYLPNFVYTLGGFQCTAPVIDPMKPYDVATWCNEGGGVNYVLYENLAPARSFDKFITKNLTSSRFLEKYLQVLYALRKGEQVCNFGHNDLHSGNVLIRTIRESYFYIPYETERGVIEYMLTDGIATIIDYGFSHIEVMGKHYGNVVSLHPNRSYTLGDAYRLLAYSLMIALTLGNQDLVATLSKMIKFFNQEETATEIIERQRKMGYIIPYTTEATLDDFLLYIRTVCRDDITFLFEHPASGYKVLTCDQYHPCPSGSLVMDFLGVNTLSYPRTLVELYDILSKWTEEERIAEASAFFEKANYPILAQRAFQEINNLIMKANRIAGQIRPIHLEGLSPEQLFNEVTLAQAKSYLTQASALYDCKQRMDLIKRAFEFMFQVDETPAILARYREVMVALPDLDRYLREVSHRLRADRDYIVQMKLNADTNAYLQKHVQYHWYWRELPSFFYLLS